MPDDDQPLGTDLGNTQEIRDWQARRCKDASNAVLLTVEDAAILKDRAAAAAPNYCHQDTYDFLYLRGHLLKHHQHYHFRHVALGWHKVPTREWTQAFFAARARVQAGT